MQTIHPGAAYHEGDPIRIEHEGIWRECVVERIAPILGITRFGLRWMLTVRLDDGTRVMARCDDDGRNHTWRQQVMPSDYVAA